MTSQQTLPTGVTRVESKGEITFDKMEPAQFKKDVLSVQIRQVFNSVTSYPSQKVSSNMQASLVDESEFGFTTQDFKGEENRVAWIFVPKSYTEEKVKGLLKKANEAGAIIYKVLSNEPILDDNQKAGITAGLTTLDVLAKPIRYPAGDAREGQLILDKNGNVQYRRTFFWNTHREDVDVRDANKVYVTPEVKAELEGAAILKGQQI